MKIPQISMTNEYSHIDACLESAELINLLSQISKYRSQADLP
jgi:hypothetical protein